MSDNDNKKRIIFISKNKNNESNEKNNNLLNDENKIVNKASDNFDTKNINEVKNEKIKNEDTKNNNNISLIGEKNEKLDSSENSNDILNMSAEKNLKINRISLRLKKSRKKSRKKDKKYFKTLENDYEFKTNSNKNKIENDNINDNKEDVVKKGNNNAREYKNRSRYKLNVDILEHFKNREGFYLVGFLERLLKIVFFVAIIIVFATIIYEINDKNSFHSVSLKEYKDITNKEEALQNAYALIANTHNDNNALSATNLNLAKVYEEVEDVEVKNIKVDSPTPVSIDGLPVDSSIKKSSAFQIYELLQTRHQTFLQELYNMADMNPVSIVRQYHYDGKRILGKYNPEDSSHVKGKTHTYFIPNFSNVNIVYVDGDGNLNNDENNIKDIMCLASVFSYYHDPYDTSNFLKHCYDLFDNSYNYIANISDIYYCTGCMHYMDTSLGTPSEPEHNISYDKITMEHNLQKVSVRQKSHKKGTLQKMEDLFYTFEPFNYDDYINKIFAGEAVTINNYCPGHIDLNIAVQVLTLDDLNGLTTIDKNFGNRGLYYNKDWHGWEPLKISQARKLLYKDWDEAYGIGPSYVEFVKPLTQEEINFYLNKLSPSISPNRKKVVETALRSVGKIPYYYGGKTYKAGFSSNEFGSKVKADYKGRNLKGLDCSGWINWVYMTAFNKRIIKSEGTDKLSTEGIKITRKELLPGDIIVRPGIDSHVMMFLEWAGNGKMKVIHENGGVNNVSIGIYDAYYPYYRRIINT